MVSIFVVYASFTWDQVIKVTSGPLWYSITLLAVAVLFGREIWVTYRGTKSIALSVVSVVLTVAAFAIVGGRLVAMAR